MDIGFKVTKPQRRGGQAQHCTYNNHKSGQKRQSSISNCSLERIRSWKYDAVIRPEEQIPALFPEAGNAHEEHCYNNRGQQLNQLSNESTITPSQDLEFGASYEVPSYQISNPEDTYQPDLPLGRTIEDGINGNPSLSSPSASSKQHKHDDILIDETSQYCPCSKHGFTPDHTLDTSLSEEDYAIADIDDAALAAIVDQAELLYFSPQQTPPKPSSKFRQIRPYSHTAEFVEGPRPADSGPQLQFSGLLSPLSPFLRPPLPNGVTNIKSPIQGLNPSPIIRTCFRISEARKDGLSSSSFSAHEPGVPASSPTRPPILIELYAFVEGSYRLGDHQYFYFTDLFFPSQKPCLLGIWTGWVGNPVYEQCSRDFLGVGGREWGNGRQTTNTGKPSKITERKMCRVIGAITIVKDLSIMNHYARLETLPASGTPQKALLMTVRSIHKAERSDVEYMKGLLEP
ncbi:predicted protein [Uncinocarpus reesii 1704]|uniref:Uncharacterized protein n=1 Tax=Uncinocarpus reesii (strain UAMH 1704) TaxID=336963 RepID=C4JGV7_UNCRE|nr:uncharacterized protein UREG_01208 [Uncinocarpus reesii 1704]EEP76359.1 predicted protein [Uncinocarpus reesii 1704]